MSPNKINPCCKNYLLKLQRWNCIVTNRIIDAEGEFPSFDEFTKFIGMKQTRHEAQQLHIAQLIKEGNQYQDPKKINYKRS